MGCVWQSDYAQGPVADGAGAAARTAALHRKPPLWRRAGQQAVPFLAAAAGRCRPWAHPASPPGPMPLARGR
jgi:hypothetical protein